MSGSTLDGTPTTLGKFTIEGSSDLVTAVNTFFAQGNSVGVYVLELGDQDDVVADEVAALKAYIEEPLKRFYAYLVPFAWDKDPDFITLAKLYASNESKQYFFTLTDEPTDTNYLTPYDDIKSVIALCDDTYPVTNAAAAVMWNFVSPSPSEINKVPPMAFRFLLAVNANAAKSSILSTMKAQNINYVGTGAEGGIANTILVAGVTGDGNDMTYWYSVDWVQINVDMMLANAVINGSNNPINPLYYNQDGKATYAAAKYLQDNMKRYDGDIAKSLTQYNGGRIDKEGNLSLKKETVDYLIKILPKVEGGIDQHPGIMWQLSEARGNLTNADKDARATIKLDINQMPGSDISAQVKGIYVTPR